MRVVRRTNANFLNKYVNWSNTTIDQLTDKRTFVRIQNKFHALKMERIDATKKRHKQKAQMSSVLWTSTPIIPTNKKKKQRG